MLVDGASQPIFGTPRHYLRVMFHRCSCFNMGRSRNSWVDLFIARFVLGFIIGPKPSTVLVYAAECAPAPIRGALVMRELL